MLHFFCMFCVFLLVMYFLADHEHVFFGECLHILHIENTILHFFLHIMICFIGHG